MPESVHLDRERCLMGRHSAVAPAPTGAGAHQPTGPITDPGLFDRPLAPVRQAPDVLAVTGARSGGAVRAAAVTAAPRRVAVAPSIAHDVEFDFDEVVVDDVAGARQAFQPVSVRVSQPPRTDRVVPQVASASLLGLRRTEPRQLRPQDQRYARTGPIPIVPEAPAKAPAAFTRKREAALAAAALAVVGAMSGAAALLPSNNADAQAASKIDPVSSPLPSASGSTMDGTVCFSPQQLKRAMRQHHRARTGAGIVTPARVRPSSRATSTPTTSSTPTGSSTPTSSSTPSGTSSSSSAPTSSGSTTTTTAQAGALPANPSNLGTGIYTVSDFSTQSSGAVISGGKLTGAGVGKTVVEMKQDSSTKASSVPGNGNNQGGLANPVNPLYLLRGVTDLEDVTVQGTTQGHLYNGLYMTGANLVIKHVQINDIPGNSNANPGETFAVGVNRATGTNTVDDLTINGGSGALASSAGLAINNSSADWNISDLTTSNLKYSAGIALWQVRGTLNVHNYVQKGGARALGAERLAGTVNLYDPKWDAGTTGHDVTYTWDGGYSGGSINFYYSSAADVPDRKINIITNKASGIAGSVHVYIGGVQQTTSKYVTVN